MTFAAIRWIADQPGSVIYAAFGKQFSSQTSEEIAYDLLAALDANIRTYSEASTSNGRIVYGPEILRIFL